MMGSKFIFKLICAAVCLNVASLSALPPPPPRPGMQGQDQGPGPMQPASTSDPQVIKAANYAVQQMQGGGTVTNILSAQKQGTGDVNYFLTMQVTQANGTQSVYQVEVCIPEKNIPWRLKSVQQMQ